MDDGHSCHNTTLKKEILTPKFFHMKEYYYLCDWNVLSLEVLLISWEGGPCIMRVLSRCCGYRFFTSFEQSKLHSWLERNIGAHLNGLIW